jgi:hypothetical protein
LGGVGSKWRENAQFAINRRGVVSVQLVAEATEDGEGENIAAVGVVEGEIGGARWEGGPGRHGAKLQEEPHESDEFIGGTFSAAAIRWP